MTTWHTQWPTVPSEFDLTEPIMRSREFAQGLAEVREGRPARFDQFNGLMTMDVYMDGTKELVPDYDHAHNYERGRQFGCVAPATMKLRTGRGRNDLNPDAVALFRRAVQRGLIR